MRLAFVLVLATGCAADSVDPDDDHVVDRLEVEGPAIAELFANDGVSARLQVRDGFRRLGLLWDVAAEHALEVRTSFDGLVWTEWQAPLVVSVEDGAHAGHVDALVGIGAEGSIDSDPRAIWYQLRVPAGSPLPTYIVVEPLVDIPRDVPIEELVEPVTEIESVVQPTPIGSVRIYSRAEWGARAPRCSSGTMTPNRATIHHTVTPTNDSMTVQARLRQIQSFHMFTRGWCDIGYNYLVSRDGRVWRGRGPRTIGAHAANNNTGNVGISFIGTYTSTAPTATQMCQGAKLLRRLHEDFGGLSLNRTDVKGHRQYGGTSCPGDALYNRIETILSKARNGC